MEKILVTGALGQLGVELTLKLRALYGADRVWASDIRESPHQLLNEGPYLHLDMLDKKAYETAIRKYKFTQVYHLVALLSAVGEKSPLSAWHLNMETLLTVLESGKEYVKKIFWPSTIGVFGHDTPKFHTPQKTIMNPCTIYGISKLSGEKWCEYYHHKYKVDIRSVRYPGLIGYQSAPGGGTTDFAVEIFHKAIKNELFECFIRSDKKLPLMYMDDALQGALQLMEAQNHEILIRSSYNIASMSVSPEEIQNEILHYYPHFKMKYALDYRQEIADSWPESIDDSHAQNDWGWKAQYDLKRTCDAMIAGLLKNVEVN